ncbi:hypothetical protein EDD53_1228 [Pacificibacter maritimus]|uniref:Primosomal protein N' (Replication factor Y)-superfamily II helicase n=1 Tax=Pacificibacter maritimus TaxID=762213 RepID=A0A3N4UTQ6_9RHOB|nr:primosomal protein N' (replication factor Y) - superfamily II helicase [Pacificibacter maritimus]RPE72085.1 hypothetical protein EDD53_1228 [Pacificibacter maritimus]
MTEEHEFPCATCGADMHFDPEGHQLLCSHCGAVQDLDTSQFKPLRERPFTTSDPDLWAQDDRDIEIKQVAHCSSCSAQIDFSDTAHAKQCPYCASPIVTDTGAKRSHKPDGVLPFAVKETQARDALGDWLGSRWFAPNGMADFARKGRSMAGIYMPYWTYDAQTASQYSGRRGDHYYVTKRVVVNGETRTRRVRKTKWRRVSGHVSRFFDDVLVPASTALPQKHLSGLEPWDLPAIRPYSPDYLAGFNAESYTVNRQDGFDVAQDKMQKVIERDVCFDIGGDRQQIEDLKTQVSQVTFKHVLLPVWSAAYKYRGETFRVLINGQTGRVTGQRPYSRAKVFFAALAALILLGIVALFLYQSEFANAY